MLLYVFDLLVASRSLIAKHTNFTRSISFSSIIVFYTFRTDFFACGLFLLCSFSVVIEFYLFLFFDGNLHI